VKADRQREVEEHVAKVNELLREAAVAGNISDNEDDAEEWSGITDLPPQQPIDMEEEYIDEDRYTSVTVESITVTRDGLEKLEDSHEEDEAEGTNQDDASKTGPQKDRPKKRTKKFRYETKHERQVERKKQRAKRKARSQE
jgi:ribosomal RNA-processing protein 17